jgi:hypothetical protein
MAWIIKEVRQQAESEGEKLNSERHPGPESQGQHRRTTEPAPEERLSLAQAKVLGAKNEDHAPRAQSVCVALRDAGNVGI